MILEITTGNKRTLSKASLWGLLVPASNMLAQSEVLLALFIQLVLTKIHS